LLPGYDADIVIFDPEAEWVITPDQLHEKAGWTPYEGLRLRGRPVVTVSRGEVIAAYGQWLGEAGRGCYINRAAAVKS
jgi:dihydropyrimidinase